MVDIGLNYTYGNLYFTGGVPLQVDEDQLREFVKNQMLVLTLI